MVDEETYVQITVDNSLISNNKNNKAWIKKDSFYEAFKAGLSIARIAKCKLYYDNELLNLLNNFSNLKLDKIGDTYYVFCFSDIGSLFGKFEIYRTKDLIKAKECLQDLENSEYFFTGESIVTNEVFA